MTHDRLRLVAGLAFGAWMCNPAPAVCQSLGAAQNFAILGGTQVTAAVHATPSLIAGDVGVSPGGSIIGFPPGLGAVVLPPFTLHAPNDAASVAAQAAVTALFTSLSTIGGPAIAIPDQLAGQTRGPGVYSLGAANLASGGILTLIGNGTFIFRVSSSLVANSGSHINLVGAQACNVWWQIGSSATLVGFTFAGNVIGSTGLSSMGPGARLDGRLLTTSAGEVTLGGTNTVNAAFCAAAPPPGVVGITKGFNPGVNGPNGVSTMTITLFNANATAAMLTAPLVDSFGFDIVIAANPNASTTCAGGSVNASPGGSSVTLSAGSTIPGGSPGSCTVTANVTVIANVTAAAFRNTIPINALQTTNGNNITPASADLVIVAGLPPVPTLSEWAVIGLAALMGLSGFLALYRRTTH